MYVLALFLTRVCDRWEEEKSDPTVKWTALEHKGPLLAPEYEPLPSSVKFYYDGVEMRLSEPAEEVATFYSKMLDHDYTTKEVFNRNFFQDWRKFMNDSEQRTITSLKKCDFTKMAAYFKVCPLLYGSDVCCCCY